MHTPVAVGTSGCDPARSPTMSCNRTTRRKRVILCRKTTTSHRRNRFRVDVSRGHWEGHRRNLCLIRSISQYGGLSPGLADNHGGVATERWVLDSDSSSPAIPTPSVRAPGVVRALSETHRPAPRPMPQVSVGGLLVPGLDEEGGVELVRPL
jgi:hypothetical protein